jgi:hypothetical protein
VDARRLRAGYEIAARGAVTPSSQGDPERLAPQVGHIGAARIHRNLHPERLISVLFRALPHRSYLATRAPEGEIQDPAGGASFTCSSWSAGRGSGSSEVQEAFDLDFRRRITAAVIQIGGPWPEMWLRLPRGQAA